MEENSNPQIQTPTPESTNTGQTNQSPPQSPQILNKTSKISLKAVIGIIIFLLLAGGAAASFTVLRPQIMKLVSKSTPTPIITIRTSPTPTPSSLKIYTNTKYNFSAEYPSNWYVWGSDKNDIWYITPKKYENVDYQNLPVVPNPEGFNIQIINASPKPSVNSSMELAKQLNPRATFTPANLANIDGTLIDNQKSYRFLYILNGNIEILISLNVNDKEIINHFIETFKFNNSQTVDTSNWKSYEGNGYSFKYPSNWFLSSCANPDVILLNPTEQPCETEGNAFAINIVPVKTNDYTFSEFKKGGNLKSETTINVDGYNAPQALLISSPFEYTETKIKVLNEALEFDLYNANEKQIYNQILSTFKFTN